MMAYFKFWTMQRKKNVYRISSYSFLPGIVSAPLCTVTFGLMYCDLWPYVLWPLDFQIQKRIVSAETIWENTVYILYSYFTYIFCKKPNVRFLESSVVLCKWLRSLVVLGICLTIVFWKWSNLYVCHRYVSTLTKLNL